MNVARTRLLALLAAVVLIAIGAVSWFVNPSNQPAGNIGLAVPVDAESTLVACTGLTGAHGVAPAYVIFTNIGDNARHVTMTVTTNHNSTSTHEFTVPAHGQFAASPNNINGSADFLGLVAIVDGGGVSANLHGTKPGSKISTCSSTAESAWAVSGLSTKVGKSAVVSIMNPSSTSSVVNVDTFSAAGYAAPMLFQGLVVGPHAVVALNLGTQIVNVADIAVRVRAARGTFIATATETWDRGGVGASFVSGQLGAATDMHFPDVPTNADASTTLAIANPSSAPAHVRVMVSLAPYEVAPFELDVSSGAVANLVISPSSRIPAVNAAALHVTSSEPVIVTAKLGVAHAVDALFVSPSVAGTVQVLVTSGGAGLNDGSIVNASKNPASVSVTTYRGGRSTGTVTTTVSPGSLWSIDAWRPDANDEFNVVSSSVPVFVAVTSAETPSKTLVIEGSGAR